MRIMAIALPLAAASCSTPHRLDAVPTGQVTLAHPAVDHVRYIPGLDFKQFGDEYLLSLQREEAYLASTGHRGELPPSYFLAISGGGGDGAFGAGLITGWTGHGRPEFKVVTGISTGALIAPFAFLGPKYDDVLRQIYTTSTDTSIYKKRSFLAALTSDAMASTEPLAATIRQLVTPEFIAEIAAEYAKGRILLVGTTDLDSHHGVIWNMTALAASKEPGAIGLFRQILLASASIPGAFPPVMIDVTLNGKNYQ
jgi:predicted acylesterase/phospholipase RssA